MKSFEHLDGYSPGTGPRILWRLDQDRDNTRLYLVSPDRPDLTHLVEQAGWPTTQAWDTVVYDSLLDRLRTGEAWQFRLTANPTHSVPQKLLAGKGSAVAEESRGKRIAHVTVAQQTEWLRNKAERLGIALSQGDEDTFRVTRREAASFSRGTKNRVTITAVQYDGRLVVTDPDLLRNAMVEGIGPAKGYGCGLLTLAPIAVSEAPR